YDPSGGVQVVNIQVTQPEGPSYVRPYNNPGYVYAPMRVSVPPPANLVEVRTAAPDGTGAVWIPGAWSWNGAGYAWTAGRWNAPPSYNAAWIPPRWERRDGYVLYYPGYWGGASAVEQPTYGTVSNGSVTSLTLGSTATSELRYGMPTTSSGALYADFAVTLYAGRTVTFVLHGGTSWPSSGARIDPLMQVFGGGQLLAQDDDGAGNLDSRIQFTPTWTGTYIIRATTYGTGMNQGAFSLVTRDGAAWGTL
ncbi:MAG: hypothetical protein WCJ30_10930, partial [Deltaproteobacteria bacterium]